MKKYKYLIIFSALLMLAACVMRGQRFETVEGVITGHGVSAPVTVVYDAHGVPHITAETDEDLFYAVGYAMAQDRFFMMDTYRMVGRGELCKYFGRLPRHGIADCLTFDRLVRPLDFAGRAEKGVTELDDESRRLLGAFTRGVNGYLKDADGRLPEYKALGRGPELWTEADSLICMDVFGLSMTLYGLFYEYYATRLNDRFGPDTARLFIPEYPWDAPYINEDYVDLPHNCRYMDMLFSKLAPIMSIVETIGSNNWVVDGTMSASGKPILCNDPHVPTIQVPTYWYHVHIKGKTFDVNGMMFPGVPLMAGGTNGKLAWGITNARCDYMDLFLEKLDPENPNRYLYKGEWREFETVRQTVPVRRGRDIDLTWRKSVHGPILEEPLTGYKIYSPGGTVPSLKLIDSEFGRFFSGYLDIPRSRNAASIREAIRDMGMGPVAWNTVYATEAGDIGYLYSGHAPIRPDNQGVFARTGTGEADWGGWIPYDELPHVANPRKHFIVTANNKVEGPDYPYYLSSGYAKESRAARITEMLDGRAGLTVADMREIQMDVKVKSAEKVVPLLIEDLDGSNAPDLVACRNALVEWRDAGYFATLDSRGTSVYRRMISEMVKLTFSDELGGDLVENMAFAEMTSPALMKIIADSENEWFDDKTTSERETRKDISRVASVRTADYLRDKLGRDPMGWKWGGLQHIDLRHPLAFLPWNRKGRIGVFPLPGTGETINNAGGLFIGAVGYINFAGPSSRVTVDMADPRVLYFNSTTGASENYSSRRFDNTTAEWLAGEYMPVSMDEAVYRRGAMAELKIIP